MEGGSAYLITSRCTVFRTTGPLHLSHRMRHLPGNSVAHPAIRNSGVLVGACTRKLGFHTLRMIAKLVLVPVPLDLDFQPRFDLLLTRLH